jgi:hypothetical protein
MTREQRERELTAILASTTGRQQLMTMLRQCMNVPQGQKLPIGTPIVQTILDHEFAHPPA